MEQETTFVVEGDAGPISGRRCGSGAPVVLLHGGPGLSDYLGSLAEEIAGGYTTFRYQQRGLEPSTLSGPFTIDCHRRDALDVIDHTGADTVVLVGHSWGGHLAMHLAASNPERLRALVVVDPLGAVGDGGEAEMSKTMAARIAPADLAKAAELDEAAMRGDGTPDDGIEGLRLVWPGYFADPGNAPPMPEMRISLPCYSQTWESIHSHLASRTLEAALPSVRVPTVFVLGAGSPLPVSCGVDSAELMPEASVRLIEDAGHFPWIEKPGVVRSALDELLGPSPVA